MPESASGGGEVCFPVGGLSALGGCLPLGRGCLLWGEVSAPGQGVCFPGGVYSWGVFASVGGSAPGGCLLWGCLLRGCMILGGLEGCLLWGVSAQGGSAPGGHVCSGGLLRGCLLPGGVCFQGMSALGGAVSQHALRQTPPCEQNDKQVQKYYLGHNFIAAGKKGCDSLETSSISVECKPPACREHGLHKI